MERCCSTCSIIGSRSPATTSTSITPWRRRSPFRKRGSPSSATPRTLSEEQAGLLRSEERRVGKENRDGLAKVSDMDILNALKIDDTKEPISFHSLPSHPP